MGLCCEINVSPLSRSISGFRRGLCVPLCSLVVVSFLIRVHSGDLFRPLEGNIANVDGLPVGALYGRSLTVRSLLDTHCLRLMLCCRSGGHSAMRESLFVPSFCSLIPAGGRVCQHPVRAPIRSISALNCFDRALVPVVDWVRELFVDLERRVGRTRFEG